MKAAPAHDEVGRLRQRRGLRQFRIPTISHLLEQVAETLRCHAVEVNCESVQETGIHGSVVLAIPRDGRHVDGRVLGDGLPDQLGHAVKVVGDGEPLLYRDVLQLALDLLLSRFWAELERNGVGLAVELFALLVSPTLLKEALGEDIAVERQRIAPFVVWLFQHASGHGDVVLAFLLPIGAFLFLCPVPFLRLLFHQGPPTF